MRESPAATKSSLMSHLHSTMMLFFFLHVGVQRSVSQPTTRGSSTKLRCSEMNTKCTHQPTVALNPTSKSPTFKTQHQQSTFPQYVEDFPETPPTTSRSYLQNCCVLLQSDRSVINLHLMHTSYFLFVMAITIVIYSLLKGGKSKKENVSHTIFLLPEI